MLLIMIGFFSGLITVVLVGVSIFIVLLVLMQKGSANGGLGATLGGGAAESAFGAQTENVLGRMTIYASVGFFVLAFGLFLMTMYKEENRSAEAALPTIMVEEAVPGSLTDLEGSLAE